MSDTAVDVNAIKAAALELADRIIADYETNHATVDQWKLAIELKRKCGGGR